MRILIVEDDPGIAEFLQIGLRDEGFVVEHAPDGAEGWYRLRHEKWDVVILDWALPKMTGLEILKNYREESGTTPILFLTARDTVADRVTGLNQGADDYLCKPFSFEELLARVLALSRRHERQAKPVLQFEDLTLDPRTHYAERAGKRLVLTTKEYSLLAYFLRHVGEVLTRTRIYEQVWDDRYDGVSNSLEVHIAELRRKLEAHGPRILFTVRGRGYYLGKADSGG
ncbi:response regulator transcription factor [Telmatocola sphagniphila]|jgi:two-component system copper resistance phosphate regulon response regulator CusR|uniref:Response regulator transcription factor n=1 Tax=Telmatocola sphagniphila TaxID=1123043 RepID=A0A8E6B3E6_9BACT|nr:response regulator transcription factor [Telmatocola sphagniphila]QVL31455.1 response regulator transcription factor [Telmatocola sphagniphila]